MKNHKYVFHFIGILACLFFSLNVYSQDNSGFGFYEPDRSVPCITKVQHDEIEIKLKESQDVLYRSGKLKRPSRIVNPLFIWPVEQTNGLNDYGVHGISNYVDHNASFPNLLLDYNCGTRTYDASSGYNHAGTDIFTWPFGWYKMDSSQVKIVAAAAGTIIYKSNGNFDRSCASNGNNWNAVYVQHSDGSVAWYGHMKNGSLTTKIVGQTVIAGEYLGIVGSSGNSTGPHLHFEVYDALNHLIDPWFGTCNNFNPTTWWAAQRPYNDPAVNALRTGSAAPVFPACPTIEVPNEKKQYCGNQTIYFVTYYRDQQSGMLSDYKVFQPNGTIWQSWTATASTTYQASWWYWFYTLPASPATGKWRFQVIFNGTTYERFFDVNGSTAITALSGTTICAPNTVTLQAPLNTYGFNYQWKKNNIDIGGAVNSTYAAGSTGNYTCTVTTIGGCTTTSNTIAVTVTPLPVISNFSPASGGSGVSVIITGTDFTGASSVKFNNISASYSVNNSTQITATVPAGSSAGFITVTTSCGTATSSTTFGSTLVTLNLKLYLEGYYSGSGLMNNLGAGGCLFVNNISPTSTDADSVFISAINTGSLTTADTKTGILKTNGTVSITFSNAVAAGISYYIKVRHRNAITTWSASPVLLSASTTYDFTTAANKAYGNNMVHTFDNLNWAFYSGDISDAATGLGHQDGVIESQDYSDMENVVSVILTGYTPGDITGDGIVESADYSIMENNVYFVISSMHP